MEGKTMPQLAGVFPAVLTPFDEDEKLNLKAFKGLVDYLYRGGVDGLYVCGSTGEGVFMSAEERKRVAETAVECSEGRGRVYVHVGAMTTRESCELARHAEAAGADAISAVPPLYFRYSYPEVKAHYADIASVCSLPIIVYHIPVLINFTLTVDFMEELFEIETVKGLKFTDYNMFELNKLAVRFADRDFTIFAGSDQVLLGGLTMGAHGGIGGSYNVQPKTIVSVYKGFRQENMADAYKAQCKANAYIGLFHQFGGIAVGKAILKLKGIDAGRPRRPLRPLSEADVQKVREGTDRLGGLPE